MRWGDTGELPRAQGSWHWVNEAAPGAQQAKWGYVSEAPGDELLLRIAHAGGRNTQ